MLERVINKDGSSRSTQRIGSVLPKRTESGQKRKVTLKALALCLPNVSDYGYLSDEIESRT
ncbi:hypothetical protein O9929_22240 [Vibrio lentus]|nr:hypothetical protein [Vibrio lentus]